MPIIATMTADGTIDAFDLHNNVVSVYGDFGGGTLTLRKKFNGTFNYRAEAKSQGGIDQFGRVSQGHRYPNDAGNNFVR